MNIQTEGCLFNSCNLNEQHSFVDQFFSFSRGLQEERSNKKILELLDSLAKLECSLDSTNLIFGPSFFIYWPAIKAPEESGVDRKGYQSLQEYLQQKLAILSPSNEIPTSPLQTREKATVVFNENFSTSSSSSAAVQHPQPAFSGSFITRFFSLCNGLVEERFDEEIRVLLVQLENCGCSIDTTHVVCGTCWGSHWPCIRTPGGSWVANGLAIVTRGNGSSGKGGKPLKEYLKETLAISSSPLCPASSSSQPRDVYKDKPKVSFSGYSAATHAGSQRRPGMTMEGTITEGGRKKVIRRRDCYSLAEFRKYGAFVENCPPSCNELTAKDLLGTTLAAFGDGTYLIYRKEGIVACSPGVEIARKVKYDAIFGCFYAHGGNISDSPSVETAILTSELLYLDVIEEILHYLRGIPLYL